MILDKMLESLCMSLGWMVIGIDNVNCGGGGLLGAVR